MKVKSSVKAGMANNKKRRAVALLTAAAAQQLLTGQTGKVTK